MSWATQPFVSKQQFEDEVGRDTLRILLDDNRDGFADASILVQFLTLGQSYVEGFLRPVYPFPLQFGSEGIPDELVRLTLDAAKYRLWQRHRRLIDWDADDMKRIYTELRAELMDLRKGTTRLNVAGVPEATAKNKGGVIQADDPTVVGAPAKVFLGGTGDF